MTQLVSPYKFCQDDLNSFKLGINTELGKDLREYFNDASTNFLWQISKHRQTTTHALRFTEAIHLRYLKNLPANVNTIQSNQYMSVVSAKTESIPIFKKAIEWFEQAMLSTGAKQVEFGRIFISKLAANSKIDLHTDQGRYFSYYDRFHFTITAADNNIFVIGDEDCILDIDSLYWVNNHVPHWLENRNHEDRINFIMDARLS
jgi:hypothetical protein